MNSKIVAKLALKFGESLFDAGLDEDFDLKNMIGDIISEYKQSVGEKPPKKEKKTKKKRKKSAYNVFIKEMMPTVQNFPPKERFTELGKKWKSFDKDDKQKWQSKADEINSESESEVEEPVAPTEVAPTEEAPTEEALEEAPVEEALEEAPVEEAPVEEVTSLTRDAKKKGRKKKKK